MIGLTNTSLVGDGELFNFLQNSKRVVRHTKSLYLKLFSRYLTLYFLATLCFVVILCIWAFSHLSISKSRLVPRQSWLCYSSYCCRHKYGSPIIIRIMAYVSYTKLKWVSLVEDWRVQLYDHDTSNKSFGHSVIHVASLVSTCIHLSIMSVDDDDNTCCNKDLYLHFFYSWLAWICVQVWP